MKLQLIEQIQKAATKPTSDSSEFEHEPDVESQNDELADDVASDHEPEPIVDFDSDFSVDTTPPASASSDVEEDMDPQWPEPEILTVLPCEILDPPQVPGYSHQWTCPVHRCAYTIDMLHLTDENTRGLDSDTKRFLCGKRWHLGDEKVLDCLEEIINFHYIDHLTDLDIQIVKRKGRASHLSISSVQLSSLLTYRPPTSIGSTPNRMSHGHENGVRSPDWRWTNLLKRRTCLWTPTLPDGGDRHDNGRASSIHDNGEFIFTYTNVQFYTSI